MRNKESHLVHDCASIWELLDVFDGWHSVDTADVVQLFLQPAKHFGVVSHRNEP